ncbi:hypothetical protein DL93DRAFT_2091733 [Clavulina sp. PMI_390]|nr:hypothetical protein DL93DRAFT_2091733 [Clavulina sp. PMI_390]
MAQAMGGLLGENVKDPDLRSWLMPEFSTTTDNDMTISSIIMMATLQQYFSYRFDLACGIPSATLEGTIEDWLLLRSKIHKFAEFGEEPKR